MRRLKLDQLGLALLAFCGMITINACKKPSLESVKQDTSLNGSSLIPMSSSSIENKRNLSPYSIKALREVRVMLKRLSSAKAVAAGNRPLDPDNYQHYYTFSPQTDADWLAVEKWLEADSLHNVIPFPLDSVSLYPSTFTDVVLESYTSNPNVLYTVVPATKSLPTNLNATLLDTLYVPDENEALLDFSLNLMTGNVGHSFIQQLKSKDGIFAASIETIYNREGIITGDGNGGVDAVPMFDNLEHYNNSFNQLEFNYIPIGPIHRLPAPKDGRVTFVENTLGVREGIKNLRLQFVRFTFIGPIHAWTHTDNNGNYSINYFPAVGLGILYSKFKNDKIKIKPLSTNNVANVIGSILNMPLEAMHARQIDFWEDASKMNVDFPHVSQQALWGMIMNAVAEANQYAVNTGMRGSAGANPYLCVLAIYTANSTGASAPMLSHLGYSTAGLGWLYTELGIGDASIPGSFIDAPDLVINQSTNDPRSSNQLRTTIYHEYGHSLHYFKAGTQYWGQNIFISLPGGGYGNDINTARGNFFALSEGWADYIGHLFGSFKYGNIIVRDYTVNTEGTDFIYDREDSYINHLEENPTFYNSFVPRGLFYDLTDATNPVESWDRISGFTTDNIYQKLGPLLITIQGFRDKWETDHPNTNNALLFNNYNVQ